MTKFWGRDGSTNKIRLLGMKDSTGVRIGFIDANRLTWESRAERDVSLTIGPWSSAYRRWVERGCIDYPPNILHYMKLCGARAESMEEIMRAAKFEATILVPLVLDRIKLS